MSIRLLIYEDNEHLCSSLRTMFQWSNDVDLLSASANAKNVLSDIAQYQPDVILMDIDMPQISGLDALVAVRGVYPDLPVIMFTVFDDNDNIFNAVCNGASGYILKNNIDRLLPAIKDVLNGGAPMTSAVARKVLQLFAGKNKSVSKEAAELTNKENEILQLLVRGYSYKMIAAEINIAMDTVRSHIKNIYRKLQVNSATEAVYKVLTK